MTASSRSGARCSLCGGKLTSHEAPEFWDCEHCRLLQRGSEFLPSSEAELALYRTHQNRLEDPGYRRFLGRVAQPLLGRLPLGARGIDYGCGPAPALVHLLAEGGLRICGHDPLFFPRGYIVPDSQPGEEDSDPGPPGLEELDFVTCTEVAEHFHHPAAEFERLFSWLAPGGLLVVMTELYREQLPLVSWRYARDPTHVVFYRRATFEWLANRYCARLEWWGDNVCALTRAD